MAQHASDGGLNLLHRTILPTTRTALSDSAWYILTILIFITLVSIVGYSLIQQQKQFLLDEKHKEIATIADLKTSQLVQWRKERFAEGASIRANAMMAHRINDYIAGRDIAIVRHEVRLWMANLIDLGGYSRGILFNPGGEIIISDPVLKVPPSQHYLNIVTEAAKEHELILSNFHRDNIDAPYNINLAIPIMQPDGTPSRCIAVLVLDINPAKRLYPLIQSWPTTSPTAETLLVMREGDSVHFLNNLRHRKNTVTQFTLPLTDHNMPAVRAALGEEVSFEGLDYRNTAVLSATRTIPGTQWGLVAKIDVREVLSPLSKNIMIVTLMGVVLIITMILGLFLLGTRRKAETLRKLFEMQKNNEAELQAIHLNLEKQISERTRDLTEINSLLRAEVSERMQLEQQLLSAKRLEAIGQIAGGVAHEVRNPLNAILTITEALFREQEVSSNPELEPYIFHIRTQVNRLVHLMNDLLDLGRTIPVTNLQPIPLYEVCRKTIELWKSTGMSKNKLVLLTSDNEDISIQVLADDLKLQQVFFNLLENAGHHTAENSQIMVHLAHNSYGQPDGMAVVQIIDRGCGIAEDKLPHVFDPFYTDRKGGTGLGLALVKHFIENMGGSVQIWNNIPSPGCTVEVHIPLYREEL
jgi:signal transduction histidine kinase